MLGGRTFVSYRYLGYKKTNGPVLEGLHYLLELSRRNLQDQDLSIIEGLLFGKPRVRNDSMLG